MTSLGLLPPDAERDLLEAGSILVDNPTPKGGSGKHPEPPF
jgi:hypothetical protein